MTDAPLPPRDLGPNRDSHNERVKLIAVILNAIGLASFAGGILGPLLDPAKELNPFIVVPALVIWVCVTLAAYHVLGYIRSKD
jgi:hypothetical protein